MPFIIRNGSDTLTYPLKDQYLDLLIAPSEHVDLEQVFPEDSLYMSSVSPNALYVSILDGSIVRRNDADDTDIAAANAFDDAIWRWSPTRQQKEALVGQPLSPSSVNRYLTQGVFSLKAKVTGTARYGDIVLLEGTNITITDDGLGNFTIAASGTIPFAAPVALTPDGGNVEGTSTSAARSDHKHNIPADAAISITTSNAEGTSTSLARADHAHQGIHSIKATVTGTARYGDITLVEGSYITITDDGNGNITINASGNIAIPFGAPVTLIPDGGNVEGTSTNSARADHKHNIVADPAISITTANAEGTSTSISRADHAHQGIHSLKANAGGTERYGDVILAQGTNITISDNGSGTFTINGSSFGTPVALVPDGGNVEGTSTSVARADHKHDLPADTAVSITTANAEGTSTSISRADHAHQGIHSIKATVGGTARYGDLVFLAGTNISISDDGAGNFTFSSSESYASPVTLVLDGGNVEGTNTTVARSDHRHDLTADVPSTIPLNTANTEGTSTSVARADHIHNLPTAAPITLIPDGGNSEGTSTSVARADHRHDIPAATPVSIGTTNAEGTSTSVARADHVHAYSLTGSIKAGVVSSGSFTGNPKKATVTFATAFSTTGYSITITGVDARTWTYESKTTGGFTINANANANLTGDVSWKAAGSGS